MKDDAYAELQQHLETGELIEAVVFGAWGWGGGYGDDHSLGYGEPDPPPVPADKRGKVLSLADAEPYMHGWTFSGGYGAPQCYAVRIWTNQRIIWVTQYDGATGLDSAPRHPVDHMPDMPGG